MEGEWIGWSNQRNSDLSRVNVYVGIDGKIHYVNKDGADTALPFKKLDNLRCIASAAGYDYNVALPTGYTEIIIIVCKYHANAGINNVTISGINSLTELCSVDNNNNDGTGGNGYVTVYYATCNNGATISAHTGTPGEVRRSSITVLAL